jgi:hypothetical protein
VFFVFQKEDKPVTPEPKDRETVVNYSRINFFLATPYKASLEIPDYWEGNYRLLEKDNTASFYFIKGGEKEALLFEIVHKNKDSLASKEEENIVGRTGDAVFVFSSGNKTDSTEDDFLQMLKDLNIIIESFKVS